MVLFFGLVYFVAPPLPRKFSADAIDSYMLDSSNYQQRENQ